MKMGILAIILIAIIIVSLIGFNIYFFEITDNVEKNILLSNKYIDENDYDTAYTYFKNAKKLWNNSKNKLGLLLLKSEIEHIGECFFETEYCFYDNSFDSYSLKSRILLFYMKNLYKNNNVRFETIF